MKQHSKQSKSRAEINRENAQKSTGPKTRLNLFTYRDLGRWLENPFGTPALVPLSEQLSVAAKINTTQ